MNASGKSHWAGLALLVVVGGGLTAAWAIHRAAQTGDDAGAEPAQSSEAPPFSRDSPATFAARGLFSALRARNLDAARAFLTPTALERVEAEGGLAALSEAACLLDATTVDAIELYASWALRGEDGVTRIDWTAKSLPAEPGSDWRITKSDREWAGWGLASALFGRNFAAASASLTPSGQQRVEAAGGLAALADRIQALPGEEREGLSEMYSHWATPDGAGALRVDWVPQNFAQFAAAKEQRHFAIGSLKALCTAQALFANMDKNENDVFDYAANLKDLSDRDLIGEGVGSGKSHGYTFEAQILTVADPELCSWAVSATPDEPDPDRPHYLVTEKGQIYFSDRPMTLDPETFAVSGGQVFGN